MVHVKRGRCNQAIVSKNGARRALFTQNVRMRSLDYVGSSHVPYFSQPEYTTGERCVIIIYSFFLFLYTMQSFKQYLPEFYLLSHHSLTNHKQYTQSKPMLRLGSNSRLSKSFIFVLTVITMKKTLIRLSWNEHSHGNDIHFPIFNICFSFPETSVFVIQQTHF